MARHVHADKIIEAANDTSIKWQVKRPEEDECMYIDTVEQSNWLPELQYRKKPREFQEGHWYQVVDEDDDNAVYMFNGKSFIPYGNGEQGVSYKPGSMKWIGESLGKLKFG